MPPCFCELCVQQWVRRARNDCQETKGNFRQPSHPAPGRKPWRRWILAPGCGWDHRTQLALGGCKLSPSLPQGRKIALGGAVSRGASAQCTSTDSMRDASAGTGGKDFRGPGPLKSHVSKALRVAPNVASDPQSLFPTPLKYCNQNKSTAAGHPQPYTYCTWKRNTHNNNCVLLR